MILLIIAALVVALVVLSALQRRQQARSGDIYLSTPFQSERRVADLLPSRGSEDKSLLLVRPSLPSASDGAAPDDAVDWVLDVGPGPFSRESVLEAFSGQFAALRLGPMIHGCNGTEWTFVEAGHELHHFERVALAFDLCGARVAESTLTKALRAAEDAAAKLGARVQPRVSANAAAERSRFLSELAEQFEEATARIRLAAAKGSSFEGRAIWDVMVSLGLHWGDMDLFHWENEADSFGDDHLFSVGTSTEPGYFLPEEIASGELKVRDLVFEFSIPRSAAPREVLEAMFVAAQYAQQRLGGQLQDGESCKPLDPESLRTHVAGVSKRLGEAGFPPGHHRTLRIL